VIKLDANIAGRSTLSRIVAVAPAIALFLWPLLAGCTPPPEELEVTIAGHPFRLELALTPNARARGLMERDQVQEEGGMLFAYRTPRPLHFAMPHCRTPLDLAFLDATGRVLAIHTMVVESPQAAGESYLAYDRRLPRYGSGAPAQFVIELRGGRFKDLGVDRGDLIVLPVALLARWAR
jgi:uncharacterized membrane protein (UPF0127 family)